MRRFSTLAIVTLVALVATGLAIAHEKTSRKTEAVAATFTAAPTERSKTRQCTGSDGTYNVTKGVYAGTATGDPRLSGAIVIRTHTVVNLTNGYGWTKGHVTLRDANGKTKAKASLVAVNSQRGILNGFMNGRVKDGGHLLANFSAAFNADGTALTGELGSGAAQNTAILTTGGCAESKDDDDHEDDDDKHKRG